MWQRCLTQSCGGYWLVAYQATSHDVNVVNTSTYDAEAVVQQQGLADNSSLAMAPQLSLDGTGVGRALLISESIGSGTNGTMQESIYGGSTGQWTVRDGSMIYNLPAPPSVTGLNNFQQTLFLALLPNGTVTAMWYNDEFIAIPSVRFSDGPTADVHFTAIAVNEDAMFYGISDDAILEYDPTGRIRPATGFPPRCTRKVLPSRRSGR